MHKELDYNLLKVLVLIYQHRSLTAVGAILGKTESAISKQLAKLREQLKDPLFVRSSEGLEPTHFIERIMPGLKSGLNSVENALQQAEDFEPANFDQPINIALFNAAAEKYSSTLYQEIRKVFPKPAISVTSWRQTTSQEILDGKTQLGVHIFNEERAKSISQSVLFHIEIGVVSGLQSKIDSWQKCFDYPCIFFEVPGWNETSRRLVKFMSQSNLQFNYRVKFDALAPAIELVKQQDYSVVLARHMVEGEEVRFLPFPEHMQLTAPIAINIKQSHRSNPLHIKLQEIVRNVITRG